MVVQVGQAVPKSADVKPAKAKETSEDKEGFSKLLSQEIQQTEPKALQSNKKQKQENSDSAKEQNGEQLVDLAQQSQVAEVMEILVTPIAETAVLANASVQGVNPVDADIAKIAETTVTVSVKPMLTGEQQMVNTQGTQAGMAVDNSTHDNSTQQAQDVLVEDATQTPKQPIETQQKTDSVEQPEAQMSKQSAGEQMKEVKVEILQQKELEQSEQMHVVNTHEKSNNQERVETTEEDQLPNDKAIDTKVQTNQLDFAQAVKDSATVSTPHQKAVVNQVLKNIEANFDAQTTEFSFNLYPKDLGKVAVKMLVEDGMLIVEIAASNAKTQSILAANANEIKDILQSQSAQKQMHFVDASQNSQQHDYVRDENSNHQGRNQSSAQNEQNQNADESDQALTSDFLSVMQMVNSTRIQESW